MLRQPVEKRVHEPAHVARDELGGDVDAEPERQTPGELAVLDGRADGETGILGGDAVQHGVGLHRVGRERQVRRVLLHRRVDAKAEHLGRLRHAGRRPRRELDDFEVAPELSASAGAFEVGKAASYLPDERRLQIRVQGFMIQRRQHERGEPGEFLRRGAERANRQDHPVRVGALAQRVQGVTGQPRAGVDLRREKGREGGRGHDGDSGRMDLHPGRFQARGDRLAGKRVWLTATGGH